MTDPFTQILPDSLFHSVTRTFDQIEVVEQEISQAMEIYPARRAHIYNSFMLFSREAGKFAHYDLQLWRHHVRELLSRVGNPPSRKEDRERGTVAEALIAFSQASLAAPLTSDGTMAFAALFEKVYGKEKTDALLHQADEQRHESFPGAVDQLIDFARKGTSCPRDYPTDEYVAEQVSRDLRIGNDVPVPEIFQLRLGV